MEDRYIETHKTWNIVAQLYEDKFMELELYNDTYVRFCELLSKPNASVLEIGCGPGNITRHLQELNPNLKILASDVSKNMVELTKKNNPTAEVHILDCRHLAKITEKFEGIVCGFTVPYLEQADLLKFIKDCSQSLNMGGILYLSFVEGNYSDSRFISGSSGDRTYFYYHDFETVKQALELNNMVIVESCKKEYKKSDESIEMHTILNAKRIED